MKAKYIKAAVGSAIGGKMKTIAKLRLYVSHDEERKLLQTMERYNAACNYMSPIVFFENNFSSFGLQKLLYRDVKEKFGLSAQHTILAIRKVASSYRSTKEAIVERNIIHRARGEPLEALEELSFREHGSITYDSRVYSIGASFVSILTLACRIRLRYRLPGHFTLNDPKEADLIYRGGKFHLYVTVDAEEAPIVKPVSYLGVDLGVVNIATTSDGVIYTSDETEKTRLRYDGLRAELQAKGTKDAKRKLKKVSGRERRFKTCVNHCISKAIVMLAKGTKRGIALEDLKGIRERTTVRHSQREKHYKWAFRQLRSFIEYKAKIASVLVKIVDARYTSQECPACGHTSRKNRKKQAEFRCEKCGYTSHADVKAAKTISSRADVSRPIAVCPKGKLNCKPTKSMAKAMPTTSVVGS